MKNRKLWQKAAALALAAVMACATSVFAATYESGYIDVEAGSKTYLVQSILYEDGDGVYRASTWAQTKDSSKVPANYIGVKAELMSDDAGDVIAETAWKYNSTTDYFMSAVTKKQVTPDRVYSRGQVKLYTGTKHITEYAPETTYAGGSRAVPAALLS
ncbi:MAG: hypothetical protein K2L38_09110, partial [Dysosmobacter sp.]|nr:hypothetical protein [Dysosmobacter sp.]